ncbi:MAG: tRNA (cytidine(34)-2'-O)-methyltransferase [Candidatus Cloacimonadaceae bacterium]|nr:tRNA (cytidine(34)-2'-O)-methyltransferase [Candidatus Cloacimonadaceae bacterium]MDP3113235.1 tRNA (cytidine(34)-2'-O)-methyltransferase [Candidatus Cloacimonadaceae bacterium]
MIPISKPGFHVVLYQPEIPANTGNIGRLCLGSNSTLHLISPCRFLLDDKSLKRAGLDYWHQLNVQVHDSIEDIYHLFPHERIFPCTTKSELCYSVIEYQSGDVFVFGPESRGLPEELLRRHPDQCVSIPMSQKIRSINLANSVAIVIYEALRQIGL